MAQLFRKLDGDGRVDHRHRVVRQELGQDQPDQPHPGVNPGGEVMHHDLNAHVPPLPPRVGEAEEGERHEQVRAELVGDHERLVRAFAIDAALAIENAELYEGSLRRVAEIEADVVIKGTHSGVDGVYSADPRHDASATKYDEVGYLEVMTKNLKVMDATAIAFCRDNGIPIVVFDMSKPGSLRSIVQGGHEGTLVHEV